MYLDELHCHGFRCLADLHFTPARGVNFIRGRNAQGKTSLLECILFAATSKSHRTSLETDLAARGGEGFRIEIHVLRADREVTLEVSPDMLRRQLTLLGSWTFSKHGQADCARFVVEHDIDVERLFTHRFKLDQAEAAYQLFDRQTTGKGVFEF